MKKIKLSLIDIEHRLSVCQIKHQTLELLNKLVISTPFSNRLTWIIYDLCNHQDQDIASQALRVIRKNGLKPIAISLIRLLIDPTTNQRVLYNALRLIRESQLVQTLPFIAERVRQDKLSDAHLSLIFSTFISLKVFSKSIIDKALQMVIEAQNTVNLERTCLITAFQYLCEIYFKKPVLKTPKTLKSFFENDFPSYRIFELQTIFNLIKERPRELSFQSEKSIIDNYPDITTDPSKLALSLTNNVISVKNANNNFDIEKIRSLYDIQLLHTHTLNESWLKELWNHNTIQSKRLTVILSIIWQQTKFLPKIEQHLLDADSAANDLDQNSIELILLANSKWKPLTKLAAKLISKPISKDLLIACLSCLGQNQVPLSKKQKSALTSQMDSFFKSPNDEEILLAVKATLNLDQNNDWNWLSSLIQSCPNQKNFIFRKAHLIYYVGYYWDEEVAKYLGSFLSDQNPLIKETTIQALHRNNSIMANQILLDILPDESLDITLRTYIADHIDIEKIPTQIDVYRKIDLKICTLEFQESLSDLHERLDLHNAYLESQKVLDKISLNNPATDINAIDNELAKLIVNFRVLKEPIKRSIRTADLFCGNLDWWFKNGMDLSIIINMQSKAVELLLKELFDDETKKVINNDSVQLKLDKLGYARGIKAKNIGQLENYLSNLPYIRDIGHFSTNKLKKMLIALANYNKRNQNKKFLLDSAKAYALFFLTFGRQECHFGLNNIMNIGTRNDMELLQFCQQIHLMQDIRNNTTHQKNYMILEDEINKFRHESFNVINKMLAMHKNIATI